MAGRSSGGRARRRGWRTGRTAVMTFASVRWRGATARCRAVRPAAWGRCPWTGADLERKHLSLGASNEQPVAADRAPDTTAGAGPHSVSRVAGLTDCICSSAFTCGLRTGWGSVPACQAALADGAASGAEAGRRSGSGSRTLPRLQQQRREPGLAGGEALPRLEHDHDVCRLALRVARRLVQNQATLHRRAREALRGAALRRAVRAEGFSGSSQRACGAAAQRSGRRRLGRRGGVAACGAGGGEGHLGHEDERVGEEREVEAASRRDEHQVGQHAGRRRHVYHRGGRRAAGERGMVSRRAFTVATKNSRKLKSRAPRLLGAAIAAGVSAMAVTSCCAIVATSPRQAASPRLAARSVAASGANAGRELQTCSSSASGRRGDAIKSKAPVVLTLRAPAPVFCALKR